MSMAAETTVDEVTARHRKEIKAADGALRAELKGQDNNRKKGKPRYASGKCKYYDVLDWIRLLILVPSLFNSVASCYK
jgi:hypothetical protein